MNCDVVQLTEGVLQFLQSGHEAPASPRSFLAREGAGKEFRGIPELLGLQTHFMPPLGGELAQPRARFQDLPPTSPQLGGGSADTRLFSQHERWIVGPVRRV